MKSRISLVTLIACLLLANLVTTTLRAEPYSHTATGLVFPDQIEGLKKAAKITDYEARDKGLGISVAYNAPGITVTLYLFTLGLPAVSEDLQSAELQTHFKQAAADVIRAGELGHYEKVTRLGAGTVAWSGAPDATHSLHAEFSYVQNDRERFSHLYVMGVKNHFFKIRYTYDRAVAAEAEAQLGKLLAELDAILRALPR